jgi:hypothetical protein
VHPPNPFLMGVPGEVKRGATSHLKSVSSIRHQFLTILVSSAILQERDVDRELNLVGAPSPRSTVSIDSGVVVSNWHCPMY